MHVYICRAAAWQIISPELDWRHSICSCMASPQFCMVFPVNMAIMTGLCSHLVFRDRRRGAVALIVIGEEGSAFTMSPLLIDWSFESMLLLFLLLLLVVDLFLFCWVLFQCSGWKIVCYSRCWLIDCWHVSRRDWSLDENRTFASAPPRHTQGLTV